ncbi:MAG: preprotein translocase subunit SecE [Ruminococcaceae bacterium]|nr:preprotein translocase subunit SecE [Oscillospiraceae bacterium]
MAEAKEKKPNIFKRCFKFFREVKSELKKVVWPTRKQVINNALIVLAIVIIVGVLIYALDTIFQFGLFNFLK